MPQQQRCEVDAIAAHMASTSALALQSMSHSFEGGSSSSQAGALALHLAALKTLVASVLSPAQHRPTFLPQALDLFTQVCQCSLLMLLPAA